MQNILWNLHTTFEQSQASMFTTLYGYHWALSAHSVEHSSLSIIPWNILCNFATPVSAVYLKRSDVIPGGPDAFLFFTPMILALTSSAITPSIGPSRNGSSSIFFYFFFINFSSFLMKLAPKKLVLSFFIWEATRNILFWLSAVFRFSLHSIQACFFPQPRIFLLSSFLPGKFPYQDSI